MTTDLISTDLKTVLRRLKPARPPPAARYRRLLDAAPADGPLRADSQDAHAAPGRLVWFGPHPDDEFYVAPKLRGPPTARLAMVASASRRARAVPMLVPGQSRQPAGSESCAASGDRLREA